MALARQTLAPAPVLAIPQSQREFEFSDADFRALAKVAYEHAGITLPDAKRNLVYGRLSRRLRALGLSTFEGYRKYLAEHADEELQQFVNAISTNLTKFFREAHHFEHFVSHVIAPFVAEHPNGGGRLRIWSAGCSTGEEPHTIALLLQAEIKSLSTRDIRVLATDIDTEVIRRGSLGVFAAESVSAVPAKYRGAVRKVDGDMVAIDESVRSLISFGQINLMHQWPMKGPFDAIFCRNVMIYFDGPTKAKLVDRFTDLLRADGWLYIGHSESLLGSHPRLKLSGRTIYRRVG
jgi:chemotaxis protein methyltransferase CheR